MTPAEIEQGRRAAKLYPQINWSEVRISQVREGDSWRLTYSVPVRHVVVELGSTLPGGGA